MNNINKQQKSVFIKVSESTYEKLKKLAKDKETTRAGYIRNLIIENYEKKFNNN